MVLDEQGTVLQVMQALGVMFGRFVMQIALGIKKFRRPLDPGRRFENLVDLALPARSQLGEDAVLSPDHASGS